MDKVLPILIERAQAERGRLSALAAKAAAAARDTQSTLGRLEQFRGECLARSPGACGSQADRQSLQDYQRFVGRLDQAISLQQQECLRRQERSDAGQQQLLEGQRRLMAFEALVRRRTAVQEKKQNRREQRDSDEFAARAARLATKGS